MIQRSNPRVIGGFVLGGVGLLVVALLVFGSGRVLKKYEPAVIFFKGSVNGLRVGAPVDFRGVQLGVVKDISIQYDFKLGQFFIPVIVDIDPSRVKEVGRTAESEPYTIESLIGRGLRAELQLQSFVTGQMEVQLDFHREYEGQPVNRTISNSPYPEIPAVPGTFEQAQAVLNELAKQAPDVIRRVNVVLDEAAVVLKALADNKENAHELVAQLAKFSKALGDSDQDVRQIFGGANKLVRDLDTVAVRADPMAADLGETAKRLSRLLADNERPINVMITEFGKAANGLAQLTDRMNAILVENRQGLKDFSSTGLYDLMNLIRDTQDLVGNLNRTVDDLRRNPSQFLFGQHEREVPATRAKTP